MPDDPIEQHHVRSVGFHDLDGRPGFKIDVQERDGRWYLYLADFWHSGWSVLDMTDPSEPELLAHLDGPENTFTLQVQAADGLLVTSLERPRIRDRRNSEELGLYAYDPADPYETGAYVWDIEGDPASPERLGHYETGGSGTHRNFYNGGRYAYMAAGPEGFTGKALTVVDLADPTAPEEVGRWWWPGQSPDDEVAASEPYYGHGPAYVVDDIAYLSYGRVGAVVLDVSDPTDPTLINRIDFGDLGSWLGCHTAVPVPDTDLLAVNNEAILEGSPFDDDGDPLNYVFLVDVSDLDGEGFDGQQRRGPRIVSALPDPRPEAGLPYANYHERAGRFGPHNQHHYREGQPRLRTSDYLFMTWFNAGLRVFDISDPLAPTEAGYYVPGNPDTRIGYPRPGSGLVSTFEDVVVDSRGYVYCTEPQQGLFVLETDLI